MEMVWNGHGSSVHYGDLVEIQMGRVGSGRGVRVHGIWEYVEGSMRYRESMGSPDLEPGCMQGGGEKEYISRVDRNDGTGRNGGNTITGGWKRSQKAIFANEG